MGCMAVGRRVNEFSQTYPLWYDERSPEACVRSGRAADRRERLNVDAEPKVRIRNGQVALTWPQPVEAMV